MSKRNGGLNLLGILINHSFVFNKPYATRIKDERTKIFEKKDKFEDPSFAIQSPKPCSLIEAAKVRSIGFFLFGSLAERKKKMTSNDNNKKSIINQKKKKKKKKKKKGKSTGRKRWGEKKKKEKKKKKNQGFKKTIII